MPQRPATALLAVVITLAIGGCDDSSDSVEPPDPYEAVAHAAQRTVAKSPVRLGLRVLTVGGEHRDYSARGALNLRRHRYVAEIEETHPAGLDIFVPGRVFGNGSGTYAETTDFGRACGFDPHLPLGSVDGLLSLEESMDLVWSVTRALRRPLTVDQHIATLVPEQPPPRGAGGYRARVERRRAVAGLPDEARWMVNSLWSRLEQPLQVGVDPDGVLSGLAIPLNRVPTGTPPRPAPELVFVQARFHNFRDPIEQPHFGCLAME